MLSWGIAFTGMKDMVKDAPPFKAAALRFFLASLPLLVIALQPKRRKNLTKLDLLKFALLGVLQSTILFGINFNALQYVPAGVTSIIVNTHPFFVAILAHFFLPNDQLTRQKVAGLIVGFSGVLVLVLAGSGIGEVAFYWPIILLFAAVIWGTSSVLVKKLDITDAISLTAWQNLFGSLPLIVLGFGFESKPINWTPSFILWTLYVAFIASSFAWWAWSYLLQTYSASRIAVFAFLSPVFGVLGAVVLLGEDLTYGMLVGVSLVALGIIIVNRKANRKENKKLRTT
jgi:drug/metabolite transporter (DMT)-like permease